MSTSTHADTHRNLVEITDANFEKEVLQSPIPVLVDFTAAWCPPCRAIAPHVEAIADAQAGSLKVGTCDVDGNNELTAKLDIRAMPTLMVFKDGKVVGQIVGAVPRARSKRWSPARPPESIAWAKVSSAHRSPSREGLGTLSGFPMLR